MSGAIEAREVLESLENTKPLKEFTKGHNGGIYNGPKFSRTWVESQDYGVPFLGSSTMLIADLSDLPLLRKKDALSSKLSYLRLEKGTTLISCSGTIGRTVYARYDMENMWTSQHIIKVVPDTEKIKSGYLYAYLSSNFGVPLIVSGTYGAIIQHIEPHHISDIPVPRLKANLEEKIHDLIQEASELRSSAQDKRESVISKVQKELKWKPQKLYELSNSVGVNQLNRRFDAFHHTYSISLARKTLSESLDSAVLGSVVREVFEPNRGARMKVENPDFGVPFLSSSEVFRLDPVGDYFISKKTPGFDRLLIEECDLLIPRSGQIGGIIGKAVLPLPTYYGHAATEHLVRIRCFSREDAYYLWAIFASQPGYYAAIGTAYGTSIPSLDCELLSFLKIPWNEGEFREEVIDLVSRKISNLSEAIRKERAAVALLEEYVGRMETV